MLSLIAFLAAAAATPAPVLEASTPWWERITITTDENGTAKSCNYESSLLPARPEACEDQVAAPTKSRAAPGRAGLFSKLTFERRFSPGGRLDSGRLEAGDKLLARQVLFLTIDSTGSVPSCRVVATSGDLLPDYGCKEAQAERFRAQANASSTPQQAFMTVTVYGHMEQIA